MLTYRLKVTLAFFMELLPILVVIWVWKKITEESRSVSGYDYNDFVTYYMLSSGISLFSRTDLPFIFSRGVNSGQFSVWLVKPFSLKGYLLATGWSRLINKLIWRFPAFILLILVIPGVRENISIDLLGILVLVIYMSVYFIFNLLWELVWSQFIFVMEHSGGIVGIFWSIRTLFSGRIMPLDVLPVWISGIMALTPFAGGNYFPIAFIMGKTDYSGLAMGMASILAGIVLCGLVIQLVWPRLIKKYTGVGS